MASNGYLRTVRVGGFDKQDVLAYVDDLTSKIYTLEAQVNDQNETIERLEKQGGAQKQDFEGKKELEKKVEEAKNKIAELMANTDTMKVRIADYEQQVTEKDAELEKQKQEIEDLKEKLETAEANAGTATPAFDLGSVFMEAQNTANKVVQEAKKAAKQMEDEAKQLQDQVLADANAQAQKLVTIAQTEADTTLQTAKSSAAAMTAALAR